MSDYLGTKLDFEQVIRRVYDEPENRLRVEAEVTATIGTVEVAIDAASGDNISIASQDGSNSLVVNSDGSINTTITDITLDQATDSIAIGDGTTLVNVNPTTGALLVELDNKTNTNIFNEITGIVSGITSIINTFTAISDTNLLSCDFSGTNIAMYSLYINGILSGKKYTYWGNFNQRFDFKDGLILSPGDIVNIEVLHMRPDPGDFASNFLLRN